MTQSLDETIRRLLAEETLWKLDAEKRLEWLSSWIQGLAAQSCEEPLPENRRNSVEALENVFVHLLVHGEFRCVQDLMQELGRSCSGPTEEREWREVAQGNLRARLLSDDLMAITLDFLQRAEPEQILTEAIPYFEFLGEPAARHLVTILGEEPERQRRSRLLDVIRVMGPIALPALTEGLQSSLWFVVRNTLNLLADMGDAGLVPHVVACLRHGDARVRAAAVTALWRLDGPEACEALVAELPIADPAMQLEILFGLGQIKPPRAVPGIAKLATQREAEVSVRLAAVFALGQIRAPSAAPPLLEILRRKGDGVSNSEPTEFRVAAARALLAIATPETEFGLQQVIEDEPWNQDREVLQRLLELHRARV